MHQDAKDLIAQGNKLFDNKLDLLSLQQEIADNFYVERADFTLKRSIGQDFASHLYTSYPLIQRRDLGDQVGAMLRPRSEEWFYMSLLDERYEDNQAKRWMEHKTGIMRRAMYNPASMFQRATKEGDHDFVTFGQCVISAELNRNRNGLLYRNWHLRDMAWSENAEGVIDTKFCKRKYTMKQLKQYFTNVHQKVADCQQKDQYKEVNVMHIIIPNDGYGVKTNLPYISIFIDVDNEHIMEEVGYASGYYIIPRWATVSGSQYAYSPAMICGLPDARLFQDMTRVILEAGEKAVNPPMIGVEDAIRSDVSIYAGGITYVDAEYDERLGQVLRPLNIDRSGIPMGMDVADRVQISIARALYLDKFNLPSFNEMTAYEASVRFQEYIRTIMPIFEPMESEYNAQVCQETWDIMWRAGAFGSIYDIPQSIRQSPDYQFKFVSPLSDAIEQKKTQQLLNVKAIITEMAAIEPSIVAHLDVNTATRDAIMATGAPAKWLNDEEVAVQAQIENQQRRVAAEDFELMQQGKQAIEGTALEQQ